MLYGLNMTYDGHIILNFENGVSVLNRTLDAASAQTILK